MNRLVSTCICLHLAACLGAAGLPAEQPAATTGPAQPGTDGSMRELWRSHVQAPVASRSPDDLQQAVRRLEGIDARAGARKPHAPETQQAVAPKATSRPTTQPAQVAPSISSGTLAGLKQLSSQGVVSPAALANALYLSGQLDSAVVFYEMALQNTTQTDEKAWLLFQIGNCRRDTDPAAASKAYGTLIEQHPEAVWSLVAKSTKQLIDWRTTNGLSTLLKGVEEPQTKQDDSAARK